MLPAYTHSQYHLKRQAIALTGKVRVYDPSGKVVLYVEQRMFKLREDIRVYSDESKTREVLVIKARSIIDFSAAYDVIDVSRNEKVGVIRRKGLRSILRDEWEVLDAQDRPLGVLLEDTPGLALLRRLIGVIPQNYDIMVKNQRVADLKQRFNIFRYEMDIDFGFGTAGMLDRRLGLSCAVLLAIIE